MTSMTLYAHPEHPDKSMKGNENLLAKPAAPQPQSPLFGELPAELRVRIYEYALADYTDVAPEKQYGDDTIYTRPTYEAPRRSDIALLVTCRAVYRECWFMPFLHREHTIWLGRRDRAPPEYRGTPYVRLALERSLQAIRRHVTENNVLVMDSLRVFPQMYALEENGLTSFLALRTLKSTIPTTLPLRRIVVTIRYQDWWYWERNEPLHIKGDWLRGLCMVLPPTLEEFVFELESVERRKHEIDTIAQQMCQKWFLKRVPYETCDSELSQDEDDLDTDASWESEEERERRNKGGEDEKDEKEKQSAEEYAAGREARREARRKKIQAARTRQIHQLGTRHRFFPDADGKTCSTSSWTGSWIDSGPWHYRRRMQSQEQAKTTFYIKTVTFLPEHVLRRRGGRVSEEAIEAADNDRFGGNLQLRA